MEATYQHPAPSPTGPASGLRRPRLTCLGADTGAADALAVSLQSLLPNAVVECTTPAMLAHADAPDCVLALFEADIDGAVALIEQYRARGGDAAFVLVVDVPQSIDRSAMAMLGVSELLKTDALATDLVPALQRVFERHSQSDASRGSLARYLRQCQGFIAAGRATSRLQHRLNNPLAALLAEAELLRLDTLTPGQRESVDRILEVSHRLIAEVRMLDGMSNPAS